MEIKRQTVLIVDDEPNNIEVLDGVLGGDYDILFATNGKDAVNIAREQVPDLILLDIMMPDMDGYTVCRHIHEFSQVPVIMVTAKGDDKEKVEGLDIGADDYVTKPFSASELAARVRAVLRRTSNQNRFPDSIFRYIDLTIYFTSHRVVIGDREVELTPTEYRLLSYISCNAGRVVTPDQLLNKVWGDEYVGAPHLLQVNIARLRHKLSDDAEKPTYILTRPGIGYMMPKPA